MIAVSRHGPVVHCPLLLITMCNTFLAGHNYGYILRCDLLATIRNCMICKHCLMGHFQNKFSSKGALLEVGAEAVGLAAALADLPTLRLPPYEADAAAGGAWGLRALRLWHHVVTLLEEGGGAGSCDWVMKARGSS